MLLATACASDTDDAATVPSTASQPDSTTSGASPVTAPTSPDGTAATATAAVPEALAFTAPLVGGGEFTGADYVDKPTVFWFWAPT